MNNNELAVGSKVQIVYVVKAQWWPTGVVTGTVQKLFKNGKVAVGVHQLRNFSEDRCTTINFDRADLVVQS